MLPELDYIKLWFYFALLTSLLSSEFHILGYVVATGKILKSKLIKYFLIGILRYLTTIFPIVLWLTLFNQDITKLFYLLIGYIPIAGFVNLVLNIYFYKSFTFLVLSTTDIALLWSCFVYTILVKNGLSLKEACTFLTGLIIIIPLFAQVAYYVADGISKYAEKIKADPHSAMAAVVGLTMSFFIYTANGILFLLYPTFKMCSK